MLHLTGHHDLADAFRFADLDEFAQLAEGNPVALRGDAFHLRRGFFFDGYRDGVVALLPRRFESDHRETAVPGDDPVLHPLIKPRGEAAMNARSSSSSG